MGPNARLRVTDFLLRCLFRFRLRLGSGRWRGGLLCRANIGDLLMQHLLGNSAGFGLGRNDPRRFNEFLFRCWFRFRLRLGNGRWRSGLLFRVQLGNLLMQRLLGDGAGFGLGRNGPRRFTEFLLRCLFRFRLRLGSGRWRGGLLFRVQLGNLLTQRQLGDGAGFGLGRNGPLRFTEFLLQGLLRLDMNLGISRCDSGLLSCFQLGDFLLQQLLRFGLSFRICRAA